MRITELHRYPVKSMLGESPERVSVGTNGFAGDRAWAVRHGNTTMSGKKYPALMSAQARFTSQPSVEQGSAAAVITLPNGKEISTASADASHELGAWLDETVRLWPLVSADDLAFFRREANLADQKVTPEQMEQELRAVFSRLPEEPLPDLTSFPPEILKYDTPPGTYFDAFPILLVSNAAVATLKSRAPNNFDMRRFRPNIVVDNMPTSGSNPNFPENDLVGSRCQIGDVVLSIEMPCPRCIMTTHAFANVEKDPGIMRQLVAHNGGDLGVYARVVQPGTISQGDTLKIIE